jgi:transcriptional regulator with XRE-family HTH domain
MANIGQKIRDRRLALEMTLAELGEKIGVGASTIRKWETGYIKNMRSDKVQKAAEVLGVTPGYLIGWPNNQDNKLDNACNNSGIIEQTNALIAINENANTSYSKEEIELLRIYKELDVKGRIKLLTTAMNLESEEKIK